MELTAQPIKLSLVVAMNHLNKGIGVNGRLPWSIPKDMKHFSRVTTYTSDPLKKNAVIMGKLTWLSIPKGLRPLPNRLNVIISNSITKETCDANERADPDDYFIAGSFDEAVQKIVVDYSNEIENIYAIGGSQIYKNALEYPAGFLKRIYLTRVYSDIECDTFMEPDDFLDSFKLLETDEITDKDHFNVEFNTTQVEKSSNLEYKFEIYEKKSE
jgi:dihydrofolate reductase